MGIAVAGKSRLRQIKELLNRANYRKLDKNKNAFLKKMLNHYHEELEQGGTIHNFANRNLSWTGVITLDTIIYPTLKGALDIERKGPLISVTAIVTLPDGTAKINNEWKNIVRQSMGFRYITLDNAGVKQIKNQSLCRSLKIFYFN